MHLRKHEISTVAKIHIYYVAMHISVSLWIWYIVYAYL